MALRFLILALRMAALRSTRRRATRFETRHLFEFKRLGLALPVVLLGLMSVAHAVDNGQFENVPSDVRAWFKGVRSPAGVPCCDIADGHRTSYDMRGGAYWVPIEGEWMQVPDKAIIRDGGNPVGEAVVWYVHHRGAIIISCFVPADAV